MNKNLYHVNSSKNNVGGGSLGARETTFNSAYAGRDSIHNTRMEVSPGPQCQYTTEVTKYQYISSSSPTSQRLSIGWLGGSYQGRCACAQKLGLPVICYELLSFELLSS